MLTSTGLCNQLFLAHEFGKQSFAHAVIELVRSGVIEVFALEIDLCAAHFLGQVLGMLYGGRAPLEMLANIAQFGNIGAIDSEAFIGGRDFFEMGLQLRRNERTTKFTKKSVLARELLQITHEHSPVS